MNLKDYIIKNYKKEYQKDIPVSLKYLLKSYYASDVLAENFFNHFFLNNASFEEILSFILNENNAYEIGKYCSRISENNQNYYKNDRKKTSSDDYGYDEPDLFTKRFK